MRKSQNSCSMRYIKYIVLVLLFYPLTVLGAQGHISVKGQSITIKEAIQLIEKGSNYTFFYNAADLKNTQLKNINCSGTIEEVLDKIFSNSGISYLIKGNEVILKVEKAESTQQSSGKRSISGTVVDAVDGTPIIGANILIKGEQTGVITDLDGRFSIQIPTNKRTTLIVTYIGYKKREVPVDDLGIINIKMESDNEVLDEVVIVGSGTQKKISVTGAITSVKGMTLKSPSSSLTNSLAGKLSGFCSYK